MVTHDRYFMDRLVDHVFVMDGMGGVKDIHGNYTEYREMYGAMPIAKAPAAEVKQPEPQVRENNDQSKKKKLSFKEQKELETLEQAIAFLEAKKKMLMDRINNPTLSHEELA